MPFGGAAPPVYMSVKEAIREQAAVRRLHRAQQPQAVRLPPMSARPGFQRADDALFAPSSAMSASYASSISPGSPSSPRGRPGASSVKSALGGSSKSGLNHTSTYFYGERPLKPLLSTGNDYSTVGSYSMFGSQAVSDRTSSGAFGFGTSTREQLNNTYISPAHLKSCFGKFSPPPDRYNLHSSLGPQVLDSKMSYPSRSFGHEERFHADKRDERAAITPGPGAYRV